jgi:hypothetical protein
MVSRIPWMGDRPTGPSQGLYQHSTTYAKNKCANDRFKTVCVLDSETTFIYAPVFESELYQFCICLQCLIVDIGEE